MLTIRRCARPAWWSVIAGGVVFACGWDSDSSRCRRGFTTDQSEIDALLESLAGDCNHRTQAPSLSPTELGTPSPSVTAPTRSPSRQSEINENPSLPLFSSNFYQFPNAVGLPEHTDADPGDGTGIAVGTVVATDADDDPLYYQIVSGDTSFFEIDGATGVITNTQAFDYETMRQHFTLLIKVTDRLIGDPNVKVGCPPTSPYCLTL